MSDSFYSLDMLVRDTVWGLDGTGWNHLNALALQDNQ